MTEKEKALDYFGRHFHCSQAVLAAFADRCGLTEEQALKLGACFGSGMRKGEVCGACTGALMVLGLLYGQCDETDLKDMLDKFEKDDNMHLLVAIIENVVTHTKYRNRGYASALLERASEIARERG